MKSLPKIFSFLLVLTLLFSTFYYQSISQANEIDDLNAQIRKKQKEQAETLKKIKDIDAKIKNLSKSTGDLSALLASLKQEKAPLDEQVNTLNSQIAEQDGFLSKLDTELKAREDRIKEEINYLYKLSYSKPNFIFSSQGDMKQFFDEKAQLDVAIEIYKAEIKDYFKKIELTKEVKTQIVKDQEVASAALKDLNDQITSVQNTIAANNAALAAANRNKNSLVNKSNELNNQIQFLSARQKALLDAENARMNASGQVPQLPLQPGQYYFLGRGRDKIEGHGLGMSQWGAYGMAQKGWPYNQILTFYYTGTVIGDYAEPQQITVPDKAGAYPPAAKQRGYLTIDEYLAGLGEVPNSWPAEAIKAQVTAARTYVMAVCGNKTVCQICGTASCQVYNGVTSANPDGMGKMPFVTATKGKVILSGGAPITAFYSASHRGCSSTLNTVWGSTDRSYIQSVNDDAYAYKNYKSPNPYIPSQMIETYDWRWRTNGYSLAELSNALSKSSSLSVGNLQRIDTSKDSCGRVGRITLVGSAGTKTLTGWDFRAIFNANTPYSDYLYSTEFGFYQN